MAGQRATLLPPGGAWLLLLPFMGLLGWLWLIVAASLPSSANLAAAGQTRRVGADSGSMASHAGLTGRPQSDWRAQWSLPWTSHPPFRHDSAHRPNKDIPLLQQAVGGMVSGAVGAALLGITAAARCWLPHSGRRKAAYQMCSTTAHAQVASLEGKQEDHHRSSNKPNLIVIVAGPTGVGKSAVALSLGQKLGGAIVSADSVQIYSGLDIGANKPGTAEQELVPHYLLDVADPATEGWTAATWHTSALDVLHRLTCSVSSQPRLPIIVGGTMMWLRWLVRGVPDAPPASDLAAAQASSAIAQFRSAGDWDAAVCFLASKGEPFSTRASKLSRNDWYRLERALAVAESVIDGQTDGSSTTGHKERPAVYSGVARGPLRERYDVRAFFLVPDDRMRHAMRLDARCEALVIAGLLEETGRLFCEGKLPPGSSGSRAIGYRQAIDYLCRPDPETGDEQALDAFLADFMTATRRYAKEQMKWFRKEPDFLFVPVPQFVDSATALAQVEARVLRCCEMDAVAFQWELGGPHDVAARRDNEAQGRAMRTFASRLDRLARGTPARAHVLAAADDWTRRCQQHVHHGSTGREASPSASD